MSENDEKQIQLELPDYTIEYLEWLKKQQEKQEEETVIIIDLY